MIAPGFERAPVTMARRAISFAHALLIAASPTRVLAVLVVAQWLITVGLAVTVRHAGWIYYQGGDQLWYYTTGWLLSHGHFPQPGVGYLWSVLLAPIARVGGPNLVNVYPAIIAIQFLFFLPAALLCVYGIAVRLGGRLFGYWAAVAWLIVPLIAIKYTDAGYHERFTEALLPQGYGLTAMGDFPTTVAALVSAYFCTRLLTDKQPRRFDAIAAGLAGGAAVAIKPATALFLFGPALAFLVARYWRPAALYALGLAPAIVTLAFVKWRGFGFLPLLHPTAAARVAAGAGGLVATSALGHYLPFDGHQFLAQLDQLREHFWSVRLIEWFVLGGSIAVFIRSRRIGALVLGWFWPIVLIKTGSARADMQGGGLLRVLMPAYPAFVLMLAALPFLLPGLSARVGVASGAGRPWLHHRGWTAGIVAALLLTAVVPFAAYAVAKPIKQGPALQAATVNGPPVPIGIDLHLRARRVGNTYALKWNAVHPAGGPVFYEIFRRFTWVPLFGCEGTAAAKCGFRFTQVGATRNTHWVDPAPNHTYDNAYFVGVAANWLNDLTQGDVYVVSRGVAVKK